MALDDADGSVDLYQAEDETISHIRMSTLHEHMPTTKKILVPARRLSTFIAGDVDLLKIDVEGAEVKVLTDLHEAGKLRHIKRMHLEYHHHNVATRDNLSTMLSMLEQNGFGYQINAQQQPWPKEGAYQNILIYCYQKQ
jgi:hypothetical protein